VLPIRTVVCEGERLIEAIERIATGQPR